MEFSSAQLKLLSNSSREWDSLAPIQGHKDELARELFALPIAKFRELVYKPPPLPQNAPAPGRDVLISGDEFVARDGTSIAVRVYKTAGGSDSSRVLFFNVHGGGWVVGTPETEEAQNRLIAVKNGAVVVSVDYRRAPEYPFPYALNDSQDALVWCKQNAERLQFDPDKIILGGGSAGANIVAALALKCRDEGIAGIIGQILNIPVTCHPDHFPSNDYIYVSYTQNRYGPIVDAARMRWFWNQYLPDASNERYASPLLAPSLEGLPPALVQVAGMDPLRDEGIAYAKRLRDSGVDTEFKVFPGVPHAFYSYPELPQSQEYFQTMIDWIHTIQASKT